MLDFVYENVFKFDLCFFVINFCCVEVVLLKEVIVIVVIGGLDFCVFVNVVNVF